MQTTDNKTLLDALRLEELLPQEQEELLLDLSSLIFKGSLLRMMDTMNESTRQALSDLIEQDISEEEVQAFLKEKVPEADQAVIDTVKDLTDDILAVTGES